MKTFTLAVSTPLIATVGQLLLKHVMSGVGPVSGLLIESGRGIVARLLCNPLFLLAVGSYFLGFVIWLVVLSKLDLSHAYPIVAVTFCLVPFFSHCYFGERVSPTRWLGIAIIFFGIAAVGIAK